MSGNNEKGAAMGDKRKRKKFSRRLALMLAVVCAAAGLMRPSTASADPAKMIFSGDSRTVGMNMYANTGNDNDEWIAKVGMGYTYFTNEAMPEIEAELEQGAVVILNYGVNDLADIDLYVNTYNEKAEQWKSMGVRTYVVSVNPVDEAQCTTVKNSEIRKFNNKLKKSARNYTYIDTYSAIIDNYATVDGLHFDVATYQRIYDIIVQYVKGMSSAGGESGSGANTNATPTPTPTPTPKPEVEITGEFASVFDFDAYMKYNPELKAKFGMDKQAAYEDFVDNGMTMRRRASEEFDVCSYMNEYPELRRKYKGDVAEFYRDWMNEGKEAGRHGTGCDKMVDPLTEYNGVDYSAIYNYDYYVERYSYIKDRYAGDDEGALEQFVNYGIREGRQASEEFDVRAYRAYNEDLREEFQGNFTQYVEHYLISGINEHRRTTIG
jgi:hypothetical protein